MPKSEAPAPALNAHQRQINTAITFCEDNRWTILAAVSLNANNFCEKHKMIKIKPQPPKKISPSTVFHLSVFVTVGVMAFLIFSAHILKIMQSCSEVYIASIFFNEHNMLVSL